MFAYIVRRVFAGVIMLIVMSLVTFLLFFASPVDPAQFACGKNCSPGAAGTDHARRSATTSPIIVQWADFLKGVVKGREYPNDPQLREDAPQTDRRTARPRAWATPVLQQRHRHHAESRTRSRSRCRWRWSPSSCGSPAACSSG